MYCVNTVLAGGISPHAIANGKQKERRKVKKKVKEKTGKEFFIVKNIYSMGEIVEYLYDLSI